VAGGEFHLLSGGGMQDEKRKELEKALAKAIDDGDTTGEANALLRLGELESKFERNDAARQHYEAALSMFKAMGNLQDQAHVLYRLGHLESILGRNEATRKAYDGALALFRAQGNSLGQANVLQGLGHLEFRLGQNEATRKAYDGALALFRAQNHPLGQANALQGLGHLEFRLGQYEAARKHFDDAQVLYKVVGDPLGQTNCLQWLGDMASRLGQNEAARKAYEDALVLYKAVGKRLGKGNALVRLGDLESRLGRYEEARKHYEDAFPLFNADGDSLGQANAMQRLGDLERKLGRNEAARKAYDGAAFLYNLVGDGRGWAEVLIEQGRLDAELGRHEEALRIFQDAVGVFQSIGDPRGEAMALAGVGEQLRKLSRKEESRQAFEKSKRISAEEGDTLGQRRAHAGLMRLSRLSGLENGEISDSVCGECKRFGWSDQQQVLPGKSVCLFHADKDSKGMSVTEYNEKVFERIRAVFAKNNGDGVNNECVLRGAVFPGSIEFGRHSAGSPNLLPPIDFTEAEFCGSVEFSKLTFLGRTQFDRASFKELIVEDVDVDNELTFTETNFEAQARFSKIHAGESCILLHSLEAKSLQLVNFTTIDADKFIFKLCEWPNRLYPETHNIEKVSSFVELVKRFFKNADDSSGRGLICGTGQKSVSRCKQCKELYQHLKRKAAEHHDQELAGRWHYREKLMAFYCGTRSERLVLAMYWLFSGFGERPWWALGWLIVIGLILPWVYSEWAALARLDYSWLNWEAAKNGMLRCMPFVKLEGGSQSWGHWLFQIAIALQAALFGFALRNKFKR